TRRDNVDAMAGAGCTGIGLVVAARRSRAEVVYRHRVAVAAAVRRRRLPDVPEPCLFGDAARGDVADVGLEQEAHTQLVARPAAHEPQCPCRDAPAARAALEPVAHFGAIVLAAEAVDADGAQQSLRLGGDDDERRIRALVPGAGRTLDVLAGVGTRVERRDPGPAPDLGGLARVGDRVDAAGRRRPQRDDAVVEAGHGQLHPARVTERPDARGRITGGP